MAIHTPVSPDQGTRQEPEANDRPWYTKKAVKIGGAAAGIVAAVGAGIGIGQAGNEAPTNAEPSYSAPANPGNSPEATSTASAAPEASVTPEARLPFNQEVVDIMKQETPESFEDYGEEKRIQYALAAMYTEKFILSEYGDKTKQKFANGLRLRDYNPFERALGVGADKEDIMNSYLGWMNFAAVQKDKDQASKLVSGFVAQPGSDEYKKNVEYILHGQHAGTGLSVDAINSSTYRAFDMKIWTSENGTYHAKIITADNTSFTFRAVEVEGLRNLNKDPSDDAKKSYIYLLESTGKGEAND